MGTIREINDKKNSVHSINKITKAMQLVSTVRSQKAVRSMREYHEFYQKIIYIVSQISKGVKQPGDFKGVFWIIFASDMGLAGGYNSSISKKLKANLKPEDKLLIIGKKAFSLKRSDEDWTFLSAEVDTSEEITKIISLIKENYIEYNYEIKVINTKYISQLEFSPTIFNLLPIKVESISEENHKTSLIEFEPSKEELMNEIMDTYIESTIIGLHKESVASEFTSRRVAMENATKNGEELLKTLEIEFNRKRQEKITQEISEIIGGAEALK